MGTHPGQDTFLSQGLSQSHTHAHSHWDKADTPVHDTCTPLGCGRKLEYLEKTHTDMGRPCKLHRQGPQPGITSTLWQNGVEQSNVVRGPAAGFAYSNGNIGQLDFRVTRGGITRRESWVIDFREDISLLQGHVTSHVPIARTFSAFLVKKIKGFYTFFP